MSDGLPGKSGCRDRFPDNRLAVSRGFGRLFLLLIILSVISACSAPRKAPVVSREAPAKTTAQASSPVPKSRQQSATHYTIKRGDTLFSIAWAHGLDHKNLALWNAIKAPYLIYPGERLRLRPPAPKMTKKAPPPSTKRKPGSASSKPPPAVAERPKSGVAADQKKKTKSAQNSTIKKPNDRVKLAWSWPTKGRLNGRFSARDPSRKGVKIAGRPGQPVRAAESGQVVYAGSGLIGYGRLIIIKHNKTYLSAYGYNRKILVREGDQVSKGMPIAEMGSSNSGGAELHFEIRRNGSPVDPMKLLPRR